MEPFIGEIKLISTPWVPMGWLLCDGSLLPVNEEFQTLFYLLKNLYGGDGVTNFALPDLRSRVAVGPGEHNVLGKKGGSELVAIPLEGLPAHRHVPACSTAENANSKDATNAFWSAAPEGGRRYASAPANFQMGLDSLQFEGGGQPHENRIPVLALTYIIAFMGIFPSGN
ncbi:phage tail protein [Dyadobacter diqingensis]|uniref:phage tail protein n=1 Tax=Dyadobacter diqingensis TaxID=2938121 RepID=UPI0020C20D7B|nr:tail fiber protein [Dyadobacter diqingensis]